MENEGREDERRGDGKGNMKGHNRGREWNEGIDKQGFCYLEIKIEFSRVII
jgi:hypothetical protein